MRGRKVPFALFVLLISVSPPAHPETPPTELLPPLRAVAEFERTERVIVRYPFDLPVAVIKEMASDVLVTTLVLDEEQERKVRALYAAAGVRLDHCDFIHVRTDSYWTKDYAPWFVATPTEIRAVDFTYNRSRHADDSSGQRIARYLDVSLAPVPLVHTGGNYLTDGHGSLFSTELVWNENPAYSRIAIDEILRQHLGIARHIVLPDPNPTGINHINCWAKLLDVGKIMIRSVPAAHRSYDKIEALIARIASLESPYGIPYEIHRVYNPSDEPYANSVIINDKVIVPLVGSPWDEPALEAYRRAMPGYRIVGMYGHWLATDAVACRTHNVPDRSMLCVRHVPPRGELSGRAKIRLEVAIVSYGGFAIDQKATGVYYAVDAGAYRFVPLRLRASGPGPIYTADLPLRSVKAEISYYIEARDASGRVERHPFIGRADPHRITVSK